VVKLGPGATVLTGTNTYFGGTFVEAARSAPEAPAAFSAVQLVRGGGRARRLPS